jgi:4-amino-4-deoxy-L-arabinose transferase-like glycosyltransferase
VSERRALLAGFGLLALLALVAAVSRAHHVPGSSGGVHRPPAGVIDYVFTIFVVLFVVAAVALLWLWFSERDLLVQARKKRQGKGTYKAIALLLILGLVASLAARLLGPGGLLHRGGGRSSPKVHLGKPAAGKEHHHHPGAQAAPRLEWLPILLATGAGVAILGYIGVRGMRRARGQLLAQHALVQQFESLLDETLDDLYANKDPRAAIIAAYARMEKLFASAGIPRHESEAPLEYMGRALERLSASGAALGRLTGLFQWAKFSPHGVDETMRTEAIGALTEVRDELRAKREEDLARREEMEQFREARDAASADRTFGEDPFDAAAAKAKGSIYGRRGV